MKVARLKTDKTLMMSGECIESIGEIDESIVTSLTADGNLISGEFIEGDNLVISDGKIQAYELVEGEMLGSWSNYRNVAREGVATASSTHQDFVASNAIDGDRTQGNSRWISAAGSNNPWLEISMPKDCKIDKIDLYSGVNYPNTTYFVRGYSLQYWNGSNWINIITVTNNSQYHSSRSFDPIVTKKVRLLCAGTGVSRQHRVYEIEVYGKTRGV